MFDNRRYSREVSANQTAAAATALILEASPGWQQRDLQRSSSLLPTAHSQKHYFRHRLEKLWDIYVTNSLWTNASFDLVFVWDYKSLDTFQLCWLRRRITETNDKFRDTWRPGVNVRKSSDLRLTRHCTHTGAHHADILVKIETALKQSHCVCELRLCDNLWYRWPGQTLMSLCQSICSEPVVQSGVTGCVAPFNIRAVCINLLCYLGDIHRGR